MGCMLRSLRPLFGRQDFQSERKKHSIMFIPYNNGNTKMEFPNVNPHDVSGNIGAG